MMSRESSKGNYRQSARGDFKKCDAEQNVQGSPKDVDVENQQSSSITVPI